MRAGTNTLKTPMRADALHVRTKSDGHYDRDGFCSLYATDMADNRRTPDTYPGPTPAFANPGQSLPSDSIAPPLPRTPPRADPPLPRSPSATLSAPIAIRASLCRDPI